MSRPASALRLLRPRSLHGQMLLALAATLLLVQSLGAFLVYQAQHEGYENAMLNAAAFRLVMQGRRAARPADEPGDTRARMEDMSAAARPLVRPGQRGFPLEVAAHSPLAPGEARDAKAEAGMRTILDAQSFPVTDVVVIHREVGGDAFARRSVTERQLLRPDRRAPEILDDHLLVVGVRQTHAAPWLVARVRSPGAARALVWPLLVQTMVIYAALMVVVTLILRRITRPLAAMTRRVAAFAGRMDLAGQIAPSGPEDMRRLIVAHNAMEARIVALLDEKDVMLGAIGHDLKTPLSALRVRIETVEDDAERSRMAATIEDIVRTLDDILSLARVGRPSDPLERTELSALVASVVEDYEDMGEPAEFGESTRVVLPLRATWVRRALRNLVGNALRYGGMARVSLLREKDRAVIVVEDEGPGIPEGQIDAMMNPFVRGDPSRNSGTGGAGLGLALARAIAEQHGGRLVLANRRGTDGTVAGLVARLELPIA